LNGNVASFSSTEPLVCWNFFREEEWYEHLGGDDNPLADAITDRIVYDAYKINIESIDPFKDISTREVYWIDQNTAQ